MASKIPVSELLAEFQTMLREHWAYDWSGAQRGKVSCAGAFVYAYKQHGISISHGSNYMARNEVVQLIPIAQATVVPGMVAFKVRKPGDEKYDLPSKYRQGGASYNGDLNDYYHVGLVDENTAKVLNAQGTATGFVSSPISQNWTHVAYLKQVQYDGAAPAPVAPDTSTPQQPSSGTDVTSGNTATVTASSGSTVKMRQKPSKDCRTYWDIPIGAVVDVRGPASGGWTPIAYGGRSGYMMSEFLSSNAPATVPPIVQDAPEQAVEPTGYALTLFDLSLEEAQELAALYPANSPQIEPCHG